MSRSLGKLQPPSGSRFWLSLRLHLESAQGALGPFFRFTAHLPSRLLTPKVAMGLWRSCILNRDIPMANQSGCKWVLSGFFHFMPTWKCGLAPFKSFDNFFKGTLWVKEQRMYSCPHFPTSELLLEYAFSLLHIHTHWHYTKNLREKSFYNDYYVISRPSTT